MKINRRVRGMTGGILVGSAFGAAGVLAGIFLAPKSGKQLRSDIYKKASRTWDKIEGLL